MALRSPVHKVERPYKPESKLHENLDNRARGGVCGRQINRFHAKIAKQSALKQGNQTAITKKKTEVTNEDM